jgi:lipopolysaccharide transport system permease protein
LTSTRIRIRPKSEPLGLHLRPAELGRTLWRHRQLVARLGRRQVQARHRGSFLGFLWTLLNPLLLLAVYTLVFTVLMPVDPGPEGRLDFVLRLFCGIVVFSVFSETVQRAAAVIPAHANYVKKVVFPLEVLPAADLWASAALAGVNAAVLLVVVTVTKGAFPWTAVLFPLVVPPLLLVTLGVSWFVASLGVYVRDIASSIGVLMTMLFFLTPVCYRSEAVPPEWRWLVTFNPLAVLVDAARATLVATEPPDWRALGVAWLLAAAVAQAGFAWFRATKRGFADVL